MKHNLFKSNQVVSDIYTYTSLQQMHASQLEITGGILQYFIFQTPNWYFTMLIYGENIIFQKPKITLGKQEIWNQHPQITPKQLFTCH